MSDLYRPDWPLVRISDLAEINIGGTPSRAAPQFWATKPEGSPWIAISDLKGKYVDDTREYITDLGAKCSNVKLIEPFTTVMSFKLTVGRTAITTRPMYCNEAIAIFSPKNDALSGGWLYHALPRAALSVVTDNAVKGATLNKAKMAEMTAQLPPIAEQRKIAQILDTLDTAIRETEALIDKLKAVKQGLLHDLLTRGIDANGQLRPPQSEAPQLYKESLLGWIPREWEVMPAESVCEAVIDCKNRTPPIVESGHPVVRTPNVREGRFVYEELVFTDEASYKIWTQRGRPRPGDVLITREAPVGEACLVPADMQGACLGQRMMMYQPDPSLLRSDFMLIALMSQPVQRVLIDKAGGSTVGHVRVGDIRRLAVPVPSLPEQALIVDQYQAAVDRLGAEESTLVKLRDSKSGLMDDLLTGRLRVTPLLEASP